MKKSTTFAIQIENISKSQFMRLGNPLHDKIFIEQLQVEVLINKALVGRQHQGSLKLNLSIFHFMTSCCDLH